MIHTFPNAPVAMKSIALEASVIGNMVSSVTNYFPELMERLSPMVSRITSTSVDLKKGLTSLEHTVASQVEVLDYAGHTRLFKIEVPQGFVGNTVDYLTLIDECFAYFKQITEPAMDDYYILIASILTNKEAKKSLKDHSAGFKALDKGRNVLNDRFNKFFKQGSNVAMSTFGTHYAKNEELRVALQKASALEGCLKNLNLDAVKDKTQRIADTIETLIKQTEDNKIAYMTPPVVSGLAQGAHEIAMQVEFLSVNVYRALAILKSMDDSIERMKRLV